MHVIKQIDIRATGAQGTIVPVPVIQGFRSVVQAIYSLEVDRNLHTARMFRSWLCHETARGCLTCALHLFPTRSSTPVLPQQARSVSALLKARSRS